jgi:hypothetical protein
MNDSLRVYCPLCKDKYLHKTGDDVYICDRVVAYYDAPHSSSQNGPNHYVDSLNIISINEPPFVFIYLKKTNSIEVWSHLDKLLLRVSGPESDFLSTYYRFSKLKAFL